MKKDFAIFILFGLIAYPLVVLAAHQTQSYAIFQSRGASHAPPAHLDVDQVVLTTPDGEQLNAWWLQTPGANKVVLFYPPNGTNISHHGYRLNTFRTMGVNALLVDYRGYGRSTGRIKREQDIYTDGLTAWNYLVRKKGVDPKEIIIWGRSLGGAVAAEIARCKQIGALVLESTFFSLDDIARERYWFLPTSKLLKFHFENGKKLNTVSSPVIIIHSVNDDYIPFDHATRLFNAAPGPTFIIKTTGTHLDSFDQPGVSFASQPVNADEREATLSMLMEHLE